MFSNKLLANLFQSAVLITFIKKPFGGLEVSSGGRVPALQEQSPEFKL
jgi:hypothetical protein